MVRRQAHWQVASSYKPLRASPLKSCMVSSGLNYKFSCICSCSTDFLFCSAFRFHQNWKGWHRYLKRQRQWPKQVRQLWSKSLTHDSSVWSFFLSFGLGLLSHKHMIFQTPVTWECPSKKAMWQIKAGVTVGHQRILLLDKEVKTPRRVAMMRAHAVPQENLILSKCLFLVWVVQTKLQ